MAPPRPAGFFPLPTDSTDLDGSAWSRRPVNDQWRRAIASQHGPTATVRAVAQGLALHISVAGTVNVANATIIAETGLSERSVRDGLRTLEDLGWLRCDRRGGVPGGPKVTHFTAAIPTLGTWTPAAPAPELVELPTTSLLTSEVTLTRPLDESDAQRVEAVIEAMVDIEANGRAMPRRWRTVTARQKRADHAAQIAEVLTRHRPDVPAALVAARAFAERAPGLDAYELRPDPPPAGELTPADQAPDRINTIRQQLHPDPEGTTAA